MEFSHQEHRHPVHEGASRPLKYALGIVLFIMIAEVLGGIISNSLALLSDAGHMLVDALALGLTLFAITVARRPATPTRTFGYHRVEIMAALVNGVTLVVVAIVVIYEAYQRFLEPPEVQTPIMLAVAVVGLFANFAGILLLRGASGRTLNVKAAFWHIIGDTISSVGVIAAAVVIATTGWAYADPLIAVIISVIILWGAVELLRESTDILLEAVPRGIRIDEVIKAIKEITGVNEVHDIHIWVLTSNINALSAHLVIEDRTVSSSAEIVQAVNSRLEKLNITHTTFQLECDTCTSGFVCGLAQHKH